jgi:hypothetical protein
MRQHSSVTKPRLPYAGAGDEPPLKEILDSSIVHLLMQRDHLSNKDVWAAIDRGRSALRRRAKLELRRA